MDQGQCVSGSFVAWLLRLNYLSLAQINGHMSAQQELAQRMDESRCQGSRLIEHNLNDLPTGISQQKATNMKDIAHHAQGSVVLQGRAGQPVASPDDHIVRQSAQQHHHLLSGKAFFAAFADAQSLLVTLEGGFDAASTLIVESDIGQQHRRWILHAEVARSTGGHAGPTRSRAARRKRTAHPVGDSVRRSV